MVFFLGPRETLLWTSINTDKASGVSRTWKRYDYSCVIYSV